MDADHHATEIASNEREMDERSKVLTESTVVQRSPTILTCSSVSCPLAILLPSPAEDASSSAACLSPSRIISGLAWYVNIP
jgi:hypothetical protein